MKAMAEFVLMFWVLQRALESIHCHLPLVFPEKVKCWPSPHCCLLSIFQ